MPEVPQRLSCANGDDRIRRDPETAEEYLSRCSSGWIHRKCARQLALEEYKRGILLDTDEIDRRRVEARRQAKEERAQRLSRQKLVDLYRGAGLIKRWCADNHGVEFGPADYVQVQMKEQCRLARQAEDEPAHR